MTTSIISNSLKVLLLCLAIAIIGNSCKKQQDFDKEAMLNTVVDDYVLPKLTSLLTLVNTLDETATSFVQNPTTNTLNNTQQAWKETMKIWSQIEMLYFGPGRDQYRYLMLDNTPVNTTSIEQSINSSTTLDSAAIANMSSYTKGLATVEYLLFSTANSNDLVDLYTTNTTAAQRANYLTSTIKNAKKLIAELLFEWSPNGGNYATELSSNTSNKTLGGIGRFSNAMIHITQTMARKKIGKPLGKEAANGTINAELLESKYADYSWEMILNNLRGVQQIFGTNDNNRLGAYLSSIVGNDGLTNDIATQITTIETAIVARNSSLKSDLTSDTAAVEAIYDQLKALYQVLSTDMAVSFEVTVLTNTDDGD